MEKKASTIIAIPLPGDNLPGFVSNLTSNVKKRNWKKGVTETVKHVKGAVKAGKILNLFILNEDMNDIIKITKSLEDSDV